MERLWLLGLLLGSLIILLLFGGCPGPGPTPPTPTPPPPPEAQLLLRQQGGLLYRDGQQHTLFGAIPCWDPEELNHGGWAGANPAWIDYASAYGANAYHFRMGPAMMDAPDVTWTGGLNQGLSPYLNDDSTQGFNQAWWDRVREWVVYAKSKGGNVEVDLIDGWICKHAKAGNVRMPWPQADVAACGVAMTQTHREFVRKVVETVGDQTHVIWQDGNEVGLVPNYRPAWTFELQAYVRQLEAEKGYPVHMFGTNSGREEVEADGRIDYITTHYEVPNGPRFGKWFANNEWNGSKDPALEHQKHCESAKAGQAYWYWRGAATQEQMDQTFELIRDGCGIFGQSCPPPRPEGYPMKWELADKGAGWWDATPLVYRDHEYCCAIDMCDFNGNPRFTCPARNEGHPDRLACEQVLMGAPAPVWRSDGTVETRSNGFGARTDGTWLEVCNGDLSVCERAQ